VHSVVKKSSKICSELKIYMFRIKNTLVTQNRGKFVKLVIKHVHSCKDIMIFFNGI
jgi:uncharacterized membrane protein SirB2